MNVKRMKVRLLQVVVDESLGSLGNEHTLSTDFPVSTEFWIYRDGGQRSRRWTLTEPKKAPARIGDPDGNSRTAVEPTSRPMVTSGQGAA